MAPGTFAAAHEESLSIAVDLMEAEARRRAIDGILEPVYHAGKAIGAIRRYSDTMLIFLLEAAKPEKYRDNYPGFAEPPRASREEVLNELHKKTGTVGRQAHRSASTQ